MGAPKVYKKLPACKGSDHSFSAVVGIWRCEKRKACKNFRYKQLILFLRGRSWVFLFQNTNLYFLKKSNLTGLNMKCLDMVYHVFISERIKPLAIILRMSVYVKNEIIFFFLHLHW